MRATVSRMAYTNALGTQRGWPEYVVTPTGGVRNSTEGSLMSKERANMRQIRRNRWERQRQEAVKREQIERCYRQHRPPQVEVQNWRNKKGQEPNGLFTAYNRPCTRCGRICAIGTACVYCLKHTGIPEQDLVVS